MRKEGSQEEPAEDQKEEIQRGENHHRLRGVVPNERAPVEEQKDESADPAEQIRERRRPIFRQIRR